MTSQASHGADGLADNPDYQSSVPRGSDQPGDAARKAMKRARTSVVHAFWPNGWLAGYMAATLAITVASIVIALVSGFAHVENISLVYLMAVLWLAAKYGRGPAILASVLAFLTYDFFFIAPVHRLTVDDPSEWLSLFALLVTSLVLGQLTGQVQERARDARASEQHAIQSEHEARASEQRTATLYSLAQLIVSTTNTERLYSALVESVVRVFKPYGVAGCALFVPNELALLELRAAVPTESDIMAMFTGDDRASASEIAWSFEHGSPVGGGAATLTQPPNGSGAKGLAHYFVPLKSGRQTVGVLGIVGSPSIRDLLARPVRGQLAGQAATSDPQVVLFNAFCDQLALALERATLQRQAIHTEALLESDRLKDALLGSVTHDLRTPLASIKAATSSLLQSDVSWSEDDRREMLSAIDVSADRLNRLVSNLLDLSRLEAGAALPAKDWYFIGEIIATVLDRLDLAGVTKNHHVVVDVPPDVPLVPMDYGQIDQVLSNLIENATKYSPEGSEITISAHMLASPELEVRVTDQGIGIPEHELHAIFDKFYRVQHVQLPWATFRPPAGTGLGLAICASIIEAHGGRIWVESKPGMGSSFIFTLPVPAAGPEGTLPEIAGVDQVRPDTASSGASTTTQRDTSPHDADSGTTETMKATS